MRIYHSLVLAFALILVASGAFWASSSLGASPNATLPEGETLVCPTHCNDWGCEGEIKDVSFNGLGTFQTVSTGGSPVVAVAGKSFVSRSGVKTVPLRIASIDGNAVGEGIGETRFWLDASRPVTSAMWEKVRGTEFPAIQEMRFHFFFMADAMPGKIFRSVNPAIMRTNNLRSFPPPAGTLYLLMKPVALEEINEPGVIVGQVLTNRLTMGQGRFKPPLRSE